MGLTTIEKALRINLDHEAYGTVAEIGAGQEVARNFFLAGGAAGTVAKTMSAYDMQVSDEIYGEEPNKRYVSQSRVQRMVDREYDLVINRLRHVRPAGTRFFSFADTVAAKGYKERSYYHGWMGLKFQHTPNAEPSQIILHVRMKDRTNQEQQAALGILGINLIFASYYLTGDPEKLIESLGENLSIDRTEIDMIKFTGPAFDGFDNRLLALQLVKSGLTHSIIFTKEGEPIHAADLFYKKNVIVLRGSFRPFNLVHSDIVRCGKEAILNNEGINSKNLLFLAEISMQHLISKGDFNVRDYLGRIDILNKMGLDVQISDYLRTFRLKEYLKIFTEQKIDFVMGIRDLVNTFTEHFYEGLPGEIYEGLGILFSDDTKVYVYPKQTDDGGTITLNNLKISDDVYYLLKHFVHNERIEQLEDFDKQILSINTSTLRQELQSNSKEWINKIPIEAYNEIVTQKLFGYEGSV